MTEAITKQGRLRGVVQDGVAVFRNIPFAAPPVGAGRFAPTRPPASWDGVRDATEDLPAAPQPEPAATSPWTGMSVQYLPEMREDCLYLNVWTPAPDGARRPVLVWIHGGAFRTGSGGSPSYAGSKLAARGDVVVVTVNYRLGALGFLYLPELGAANFGILDQVAALQWVQENIANFGGDPDNVTVFGESAGGKSVETLMATPAARGLFRRAIAQSTYDPPMDLDTANRTADAILEHLGVKRGDLDRLRALPWQDFVRAQNAVAQPAGGDLTSGYALVPVVDGESLPRHPREAFAEGFAAGVETVIGTTLDESKLFSAMVPGLADLDEAALHDRLRRTVRGADRDEMLVERLVETYRRARTARGQSAGPADVWNAVSTDRTFRQHSLRLAESQSRHQPSTYMYLFTWTSPLRDGFFGACHAIDIPFVFGSFDTPMGALAGDSPEARALSEKVMDAWLAFARKGDPSTPGLPAWQPYEPSKRLTMLLGRECCLESAPEEEERRFWASLD